MKRNFFLALAACFGLVSQASDYSAVMPAPLCAGDTIAVISPGSTPSKETVDKACSVLRSWGFVPVTGESVLAKDHMYAGTVAERKRDLLWALRDPSVKAILCSRGGYGSSMLLYDIPVEVFAAHPKWIVGYSDITALHSAEVRAGVMSVHGNMGGRLAETGGNDESSQTLRRLLLGELPNYTFPAHKHNRNGVAKGILIGGNLSVFCNISGSEQYDFLDRDFLAGKDVVLFFEDVSESLPRINSMLYQLKLKGVIDRVKGIIIGRFTEYEKPQRGYEDADEMLHEYLSCYDIPICYDFPVSHDENWNMPMIEGCPVTLTITDSEVKLEFKK